MKSLATTTDADAIETASGGLGLALWRVISVLSRPSLKRWRFRMAIALALTVAAKFLSVASPLYLGDAITKATKHEMGSAITPLISALFLFVLIRYLSSSFPHLRDVLFAPVSQDAQRTLSVEAFGKAQRLSLGFHQTRRSGALNRVIERGSGAMDVILRFLVFNIGPTLIELILASIVLAAAYSWVLSVIAIATIVVYIAFTLIVTEWRASQRTAARDR